MNDQQSVGERSSTGDSIVNAVMFLAPMVAEKIKGNGQQGLSVEEIVARWPNVSGPIDGAALCMSH
jgi:hypothetical protein